MRDNIGFTMENKPGFKIEIYTRLKQESDWHSVCSQPT